MTADLIAAAEGYAQAEGYAASTLPTAGASTAEQQAPAAAATGTVPTVAVDVGAPVTIYDPYATAAPTYPYPYAYGPPPGTTSYYPYDPSYDTGFRWNEVGEMVVAGVITYGMVDWLFDDDDDDYAWDRYPHLSSEFTVHIENFGDINLDERRVVDDWIDRNDDRLPRDWRDPDRRADTFSDMGTALSDFRAENGREPDRAEWQGLIDREPERFHTLRDRGDGGTRDRLTERNRTDPLRASLDGDRSPERVAARLDDRPERARAAERADLRDGSRDGLANRVAGEPPAALGNRADRDGNLTARDRERPSQLAPRTGGDRSVVAGNRVADRVGSPGGATGGGLRSGQQGTRPAASGVTRPPATGGLDRRPATGDRSGALASARPTVRADRPAATGGGAPRPRAADRPATRNREAPAIRRTDPPRRQHSTAQFERNWDGGGRAGRGGGGRAGSRRGR